MAGTTDYPLLVGYLVVVVPLLSTALCCYFPDCREDRRRANGRYATACGNKEAWIAIASALCWPLTLMIGFLYAMAQFVTCVWQVMRIVCRLETGLSSSVCSDGAFSDDTRNSSDIENWGGGTDADGDNDSENLDWRRRGWLIVLRGREQALWLRPPWLAGTFRGRINTLAMRVPACRRFARRHPAALSLQIVPEGCGGRSPPPVAARGAEAAAAVASGRGNQQIETNFDDNGLRRIVLEIVLMQEEDIFREIVRFV